MEEKRFIRIFSQNSFGTAMEVWADRETGVNYLYRWDGYSGGMTVLVDRDGKPLIGEINKWE